MRSKDLKTLIEKYPKLYKHKIAFECHNGWFSIIDQLSKKLNSLIENDEEFCYAVQVKEKYGSLRFYMSTETDEMSDLIDKAEKKSETTCEICGEKGTLRSKFKWLFTRCDLHKDV